MAVVSFAFCNDRSEALDVYVEPWPERFTLQPGELLEFRYDGSAEEEWIRIEAHEEGITLWTNIGSKPEFFIDGNPANDRSWKG